MFEHRKYIKSFHFHDNYQAETSLTTTLVVIMSCTPLPTSLVVQGVSYQPRLLAQMQWRKWKMISKDRQLFSYSHSVQLQLSIIFSTSVQAICYRGMVQNNYWKAVQNTVSLAEAMLNTDIWLALTHFQKQLLLLRLLCTPFDLT